jgi:hypothetical protein
MVLFSERKRQAAIADREANGESLWSSELRPEVRVKVTKILEAVLKVDTWRGQDDWGAIAARVRFARGVDQLAGIQDPERDIKRALRDGDLSLVADVLEATLGHVDDDDAQVVREATNDVLASHRVAFELVGSEAVEFESREMHVEVVRPTLTLLGGDRRFVAVESAYQSALHELGDAASAADAITDAGTALQEMLRALGCEGNAIGPLLKSARTKGLLASSDQALERSLAGAIDWVAADRSTTGDAHNATPALREDAWLTVHIVGALILRLAAGTVRGAGT